MLPPDAMDSLIAETFQQADLAQDGVIHAEEWEKLCQRQPHILAPMTLDVLRELTSAFPSFIESTSVFVQGSALGADSARLPACANSAHMGIRQVGDVDVIADAGAVAGGPVATKHLERFAPAHGHLTHEGEEVVGDAEGVFTNSSGGMSAYGIEVAQ